MENVVYQNQNTLYKQEINENDAEVQREQIRVN